MNVELIPADEREDRVVLCVLPAIVGSALHAEVCLDDPDVNFYHCLIGQIDGTLHVADLVSRGGTFVNGLPIEESLLLPGDELTVGGTCLSVRYAREPRRLRTWLQN